MKKGWTRGVLVVFGILLLATLVAWTVWDAMAGARLRAGLKDVAARGWVTVVGELRPAPIPDDRNAALPLNRAFVLMSGGKSDLGCRAPGVKEVLAVFEGKTGGTAGVIAGTRGEALGTLRGKLQTGELREILDLLHEAAVRSGCDFALEYERGFALTMGHLSPLRDGVRLLCLEAWARAAGGDGRGALASLRDALAIGGMPLGEATLISLLVGLSCDATTVDWLGAILGELPATGAYGAVDLDLLAGILRERRGELRPALVGALDGERVVGVGYMFDGILSGRVNPFELVKMVRDGSGDGSGKGSGALPWWTVRHVLRPMLKDDYATHLRVMTRYREIAERPYAVGTRAEIDAVRAGIGRMAILTRLGTPAIGSVCGHVASGEALCDVARVGLLLENRRIGAGGYPASLAEIASPEPLPSDLFGGGTLIYRREGAGVRVYSVGEDGRDDGGLRRADGTPEKHDIVWAVRRAG